MNTFIYEGYNTRREFTVGQKVECIYYHEYPNEKNAYQRTWLSKLIDKPFSPVKLGVVVGDAGVHPYWLNLEGEEQYLFVRFKEYQLPKPIPISCIQDALEAGQRALSFLEENKSRLGEKGYSIESCIKMMQQAQNAINFTKG